MASLRWSSGVGRWREGDPEALEIDGVVGEERQATRRLQGPASRTKEHGFGQNSLPKVCVGRSFELEIGAAEREFGGATTRKRTRRTRGGERHTPLGLTGARTSASRRPWRG